MPWLVQMSVFAVELEIVLARCVDLPDEVGAAAVAAFATALYLEADLAADLWTDVWAVSR